MLLALLESQIHCLYGGGMGFLQQALKTMDNMAEGFWKGGRRPFLDKTRNTCSSTWQEYVLLGERRGFAVHWEWAGNHLFPRCREIREESWVLEKHSWCVIIPGLGHSSGVLASISHFLQHSCSGIIPVIIPSLRWCNMGNDAPRKKRSHKGTKTSPDPGLGVLWWMVIVQALQNDGGSSESHRVCVWWSHLWSFELDLPSRNLWHLLGTGPIPTPWPPLPIPWSVCFLFHEKL